MTDEALTQAPVELVEAEEIKAPPVKYAWLNDYKFKPGAEWKGSRTGRQKGARNKVTDAFLRELSKDFEEHGAAAIARVRTKKPDVYLKIVASLVPRQIKIDDNPLDEMEDDELVNALETIRSFKAKLVEDLSKKPSD